MKAAVIGSPIAHSLSPTIFNFISQQENYPLEYSALNTPLDQLSGFLQSMRENKDYLGVNVTLPLKEAVLGELDQLSEEASAIGAVNVIQRNAGALIGFNTDVIGIQKTWAALHFSPQEKNCLILGAGGSAKAVACVLGKQTAKKVYIYNPRSNRGVELAKNFGNLYPHTQFQAITSLQELGDEKISLIVNTTPVGMKTINPSETDAAEFFKIIEQVPFEKSAIAFDLIYNPHETEFLKITKSLGLSTVGGLGMLIDQAIATWEICIKPIKDPKKLHHQLEQLLLGVLHLRNNPAPIFLTGFMGVGKTIIGKEVALITGRTFVDTDHFIEKETGLTVQQLFQQKGEPEFRKHETLAVAQATQMKNVVVSLGGGAIMNQENLNQILSSGTLICLTTDEDTLVKRLSRNVRPLFAGLDAAGIKAKIRSLLEQRSVHYARAHLTLSTINQRPYDTAQSLISRIGELDE